MEYDKENDEYEEASRRKIYKAHEIDFEFDDDYVDTKPKRQLIFTTKFLLDLFEDNEGKAKYLT